MGDHRLLIGRIEATQDHCQLKGLSHWYVWTGPGLSHWYVWRRALGDARSSWVVSYAREHSLQFFLLKQDYNTIGTIIKMQMAWLTGWQVIW